MEFVNDTAGEAIPFHNPPINVDTILAHIKDLDAKANGKFIEPEVIDNPILEFIKKALVDPDEELEENQLIASIDNTPFATLGNFSCIIGKAKSKKTFLITLIVATFLKGEIGILQAFKSNGKTRVIWFDTEQSRGHVVKAFKRALSLSGYSKFYEIEVYDLRPFSPKERLSIMTTVLVDMNQNKDIAFGVIDGIRDTVTDINDPVQATDVSTWLMKVTANQDLHICTVLHQNKGDNNARGHLGTEIINKAETVLSVQRESDSIALVKAEFCRDREFKPFAFMVDEGSGLPRILDDYSGGGFGDGVSMGGGGSFIPDDKHQELMGKIFSIESEYSYGELLTQVMIHYPEAGFKTGQLKGKQAITKSGNLGIIKKSGKAGGRGKYVLVQPDISNE